MSMTSWRLWSAAFFTAAIFLHVFLLDGLEGIVAPLVYDTDTRYSTGYSDWGFRRVLPGMSAVEVTQLLGEPFWEVWSYSSPNDCGFLRFEQAHVVTSVPGAACRLPPIPVGMSQVDVLLARGEASEIKRLYSTSPTGKSYRERIVVLVKGKVTRRIARFYVD